MTTEENCPLIIWSRWPIKCIEFYIYLFYFNVLSLNKCKNSLIRTLSTNSKTKQVHICASSNFSDIWLSKKPSQHIFYFRVSPYARTTGVSELDMAMTRELTDAEKHLPMTQEVMETRGKVSVI